MPSQIYECRKCGDRKLVEYSKDTLPPVLWCDCGGFKKMEKIE